MKILPLGPLEAAGADTLPVEREGSRRFAKKVMYLAVIACPEDEHNFDGKISFTRVARTRVHRRDNRNDKLIDELSANAAIHKKWHELVNLTIPCYAVVRDMNDTRKQERSTARASQKFELEEERRW